MPKSLVEKHCGSYSMLYDRRGDVNERFYDVILEMASYAKKHIDVARELYEEYVRKEGSQGKPLYAALLQATPAYYWLDELEKFNFNNLDQSLQRVSYYQVPRLILSNGKKRRF